MTTTRTLIAIAVVLIITVQYNQNKELKQRNEYLELNTEMSMQLVHNLKDSVNNVQLTSK